MQVWLKQMSADLKIVVVVSPRVFDTTEEIVRRGRSGGFDVVALNILEYRQIAEFLDPSEVIVEGGATGQVSYLLLTRKSSGLKQLADLRGKRLAMLENPRMCVAPSWLSTILAEAHLGQSDQFFSSITIDTKPSRVVLPVFFGQTDACLTSKETFETMCELNPQVGNELASIASSPGFVAAFYVFHKFYHGPSREVMAKVYIGRPASAVGRQLATLFQFEQLVARDATALAPTLAVLAAADRLRRGQK